MSSDCRHLNSDQLGHPETAKERATPTGPWSPRTSSQKAPDDDLAGAGLVCERASDGAVRGASTGIRTLGAIAERSSSCLTPTRWIPRLRERNGNFFDDGKLRGNAWRVAAKTAPLLYRNQYFAKAVRPDATRLR